MAISNHERVGKGLELLKGGLGPFVDREFKSTYKDRAVVEAARFMGETRLNTQRPIGDWDAAALLKLMWDSWNDIFRKTLGPAERSLLSELRDHRNKAPQADDIEKPCKSLSASRFVGCSRRSWITLSWLPA
jgi:hypothetical protein